MCVIECGTRIDVWTETQPLKGKIALKKVIHIKQGGRCSVLIF